jgi:proteasome accessory factor B
VNRLERLINLVAALLDAERPLSRDELQRRVPGYEGDPASARRAFERDKEALREMGIPLVLEPLDPANPEEGSGYRIPKEQYYLEDPGLDPDELAALHVAVTTVRLEGAGSTEALWKLGGAPGGAAGSVAALPGSEHLASLFEAVSERRTVTFRYRDEVRTVDPYRLAFRNGRWYVAGHDHDRGANRSFRLDRVASAPESGPAGAFERPPDTAAGPPLPWEMGDEDDVMVRLLVDADQADWAAAQLRGSTAVERRDDGSVVFEVRVTNRPAFRSFVLGLLDHAEVLGPEAVRAEMVAWLEALAAA